MLVVWLRISCSYTKSSEDCMASGCMLMFVSEAFLTMRYKKVSGFAALDLDFWIIGAAVGRSSPGMTMPVFR